MPDGGIMNNDTTVTSSNYVTRNYSVSVSVICIALLVASS